MSRWPILARCLSPRLFIPPTPSLWCTTIHKELLLFPKRICAYQKDSASRRILQLHLMDYVIIGAPAPDRSSYFSFKEAGVSQLPSENRKLFFRNIQDGNDAVSAVDVGALRSPVIERTPVTFSSGFPTKLIERRRDKSRAMRNSTAAVNKLVPAPRIAAAEPQITDPSVIAPCEIMITVALTRPLTQFGITRCAATQSSEAEIVHPTPATAAAMKNNSVWRTNAIST